MTPPNSASPELRLILVWVDDQCLLVCWPSITTPPEVDFAVDLHPAQSLSVKVSTFDGVYCHWKSWHARGAQRRYLPILFRSIQSVSFGTAIFLLASVAANKMSGRS